MNNNPLSESVVREKFSKCGYNIIDYTYKNNLTRMLCYDKEGYKVKVSYGSLDKNVKQYARFSPTSNIEGFMYNLSHYRELNPRLPKVIDWKYIEVGKQKKKQVRLLCICNTCGHQFWTTLENWKNGTKIRCNNCTRLESSLEIIVRQWLESKNIKFVQQKRFEDCRDKRKLPFDFYLPNLSICIEVDGEQHYKKGCCLHGHFITEDDFVAIQRRDAIKNEYCKNKNIKLIRIKYTIFNTENGLDNLLNKEIYN